MSFVFFEKICIDDRERIVGIEGGKRDTICEKIDLLKYEKLLSAGMEKINLVKDWFPSCFFIKKQCLKRLYSIYK